MAPVAQVLADDLAARGKLAGLDGAAHGLWHLGGVIYLGQDLLGDWALLKVWGGLGSRRGRMHNTGVASYDDGIEQVREIAERRTQRGYRIVPPD